MIRLIGAVVQCVAALLCSAAEASEREDYGVSSFENPYDNVCDGLAPVAVSRVYVLTDKRTGAIRVKANGASEQLLKDTVLWISEVEASAARINCLPAGYEA